MLKASIITLLFFGGFYIFAELLTNEKKYSRSVALFKLALCAPFVISVLTAILAVSSPSEDITYKCMLCNQSYLLYENDGAPGYCDDCSSELGYEFCVLCSYRGKEDRWFTVSDDTYYYQDPKLPICADCFWHYVLSENYDFDYDDTSYVLIPQD